MHVVSPAEPSPVMIAERAPEPALELMALVGGEHSRTDWLRWIERSPVRDVKGKSYSLGRLTTVLETACADGIVRKLVYPSTSVYQVASERVSELLHRAQRDGRLQIMVEPVKRVATADRYDRFHTSVLSGVRALVHGCDVPTQSLVAEIGQLDRHALNFLAMRGVGTDIRVERLKLLPKAVRELCIASLAYKCVSTLSHISTELLQCAVSDGGASLESRMDLALTEVLCADRLHSRLPALDLTVPAWHAIEAVALLREGKIVEARASAHAALQPAGKGQRIAAVPGYAGLFVWLLLSTEERRDASLTRLQAKCSEGRYATLELDDCARPLRQLDEFRETGTWPHLSPSKAMMYASIGSWCEALLWSLSAAIAGAELAKPTESTCMEHAAAIRARCSWLASEIEGLVRGQAEQTVFGSLYRQQPAWERSLGLFEDALRPSRSEAAEGSQRLVWFLDDGRVHSGLHPRVQTKNAKGYTPGRADSVDALMHSSAPWITEQDRKVLSMLGRYQPHSFHGTHGESMDAALLALEGHPFVFAQNGKQRLDVVIEPPKFVVRERDGQLHLTIEPEACVHGRVHAEQRDGQLVLTVLTAEQRKAASALGPRGVKVPADQRARVEGLIGLALQRFQVSSDVAGAAVEARTIEADGRLHVLIARTARGLNLKLRVRPIGDGPLLHAGDGARHVLGQAMFDGAVEQVQTERDLEAERALLELVCAELAARVEQPFVTADIALDDSIAGLEALTYLRSLGERCVLLWPDGKPLQIVAERNARDLSLKLTNADYWLSADGEIEVDASLTLSLKQLLELYEKGAHGRFIELDDQRFVALSAELARDLEALGQHAHFKGKSLQLHPLALLSLGDWQDTAARVAMDEQVSQRFLLVRESEALTPRPSKLLQASLRPYQEEGYAWMSRLAHWGAGICLADDMGLGKTLQTLALLIEHASHGPSLVVTPMSVCRNWIDEASRFAPTLRVLNLATEDRKGIYEKLGPNDLLVCSYGVMQQEIEALSKVPFRIVVLDEAQAIKNAATQRARCAMQLNGHVRVALTGTPVENHLGEIWSIMTFLNPGLLGSVREFEQRFARPIQRDGDAKQAERLRQLIRPFVLRRRKSEVLRELPEKTVITLEVEPSREETALFAALRAQAAKRLQDPSKSQEMRIRVLAEITRMRRAACHPALVAPDAQIESSKLNTLESILSELREGGHRALVFSQFVDYLTLVRQRMDALEIPYQYLDGSSTARQREDAVRRFQAGEGDLFLISLKAGGFGLNLTAADYVIHLDPWWNPAVEDQASDRAHRIGQTRPVTVYRLVMRASIEQKILALHEDKREMADQLLAGTETSDVLKVDALLALLRDDE